jgi:hypothetical protein
MAEVFRLALSEIQPSQLLLNRDKLHQVMAAWQPCSLDTLPPVPVKRLDGRIIFTDGHHRAFAAYRCGFAEMPVFWDEDELDWDAYRICVAWCGDEGITTIRDLEGRVVSPEVYASDWLDRCRVMQEALEEQRQR